MASNEQKYTPPAKYQPKAFNPNKKPEKVRGFTVLSFFALMAAYIVKFLLDFLLLPTLFPNLYPLSPAAIIIWCADTVIITFIAIKFITGFGYFYIPACLIYAICVAIWPNNVFYFGSAIPAIVGGLITYVASRTIERIEMWLSILIGFITM